MPSLLETQGKVRHVDPVAWIVYFGGPRDVSFSEIAAGGDELFQEHAVTRELKENGKTSYVRAVESYWEPERIRRLFLKGWPEPVYQKDDMKLFEDQPQKFLILRSEKEREAFIKRRRVELEAERKVADAKRFAADQKYVEERDAEIAKIRGEP